MANRQRFALRSARRHRQAILTVLITVPNRTVGLQLARSLVQRRLAACVNCIPDLISVFRWKGRVDRAREVLLICKTTTGRLTALTAAVRRLHPYDLPEILALPTAGGHPAYAQWVRENCTPARPQ